MTGILDDMYLANAARQIKAAADDLRADNDDAARHELRHRLQVLEAWKAHAEIGSAEAMMIGDLISYYRESL